MVDYEHVKLKTIRRIKGFGYDYQESHDEFLLEHCLDKNENYILNQTNQDVVPRQLYEIWIDRALADFLENRWANNTLNIETIDFSPMLNRIQEGDTTIDIATKKDGGMSDEGRFMMMIQQLRQPDFSYARFRRFKW